MNCYAVTVRTPEGRLLVWERYAKDRGDLVVGVMRTGNQEWPGPWSIADIESVTPHAERPSRTTT